jgi:hypothetical protein
MMDMLLTLLSAVVLPFLDFLVKFVTGTVDHGENRLNES